LRLRALRSTVARTRRGLRGSHGSSIETLNASFRETLVQSARQEGPRRRDLPREGGLAADRAMEERAAEAPEAEIATLLTRRLADMADEK
jgi:hypothetical protein